ncbi:hypothetical protein ACFVYA_36220 [Amycolatopsis sp. NPDC058278]|uniref:hypothetical protein n=1 Tax=Amycolatopsis sp. NPDC058278 TaxID=3346417 RepID=UPI0036DF6985
MAALNFLSAVMVVSLRALDPTHLAPRSPGQGSAFGAAEDAHPHLASGVGLVEALVAAHAALAKVPADVSTVRGLDLPLDRSLLTPVEELEVIKARTTLIERCLAAHWIGFALEALDPTRDAAKPRRQGLVDPGEAATYGYRDPAVFTPRSKAPARQPRPAYEETPI